MDHYNIINIVIGLWLLPAAILFLPPRTKIKKKHWIIALIWPLALPSLIKYTAMYIITDPADTKPTEPTAPTGPEVDGEEYEPLLTLPILGDKVRRLHNNKLRVFDVQAISEGVLAKYGRKIWFNTNAYSHDCCFDGRLKDDGAVVCRILKRPITTK